MTSYRNDYSLSPTGKLNKKKRFNISDVHMWLYTGTETRD